MTFDIDTLKTNRPLLSAGSIKTYTSILKNLFKKMKGLIPYDKTFFLTKQEEVVDFLKDIKPALRKTTLSALVIYTLQNEVVSNRYKIQMMKDGILYNNELKNQVKTETQKENWITQQEVKKIYNDLEKTIKPIFNETGINSSRDLEKIQDYIIASCYVLIPPRRLLDYTEFKLNDFEEGEDNYLKNGTFYFNKFKTAKFKKDSFKIPIKLKNIIQKWTKLTGSNWLLFQVRNKDNHIATTILNKMLQRIFGKGISVNALRHSFLSDYYKDMPKLKEMGDIAEQMGHSVNTALEYVKKD